MFGPQHHLAQSLHLVRACRTQHAVCPSDAPTGGSSSPPLTPLEATPPHPRRPTHLVTAPTAASRLPSRPRSGVVGDRDRPRPDAALNRFDGPGSRSRRLTLRWTSPTGVGSKGEWVWPGVTIHEFFWASPSGRRKGGKGNVPGMKGRHTLAQGTSADGGGVLRQRQRRATLNCLSPRCPSQLPRHATVAVHMRSQPCGMLLAPQIARAHAAHLSPSPPGSITPLAGCPRPVPHQSAELPVPACLTRSLCATSSPRPENWALSPPPSPRATCASAGWPRCGPSHRCAAHA